MMTFCHEVREFLKILVKSVRITNRMSDIRPQKRAMVFDVSVIRERKRVPRASRTSEAAQTF
jgi:hypothetical protein